MFHPCLNCQEKIQVLLISQPLSWISERKYNRKHRFSAKTHRPPNNIGRCQTSITPMHLIEDSFFTGDANHDGRRTDHAGNDHAGNDHSSMAAQSKRKSEER